MEFQGQQELRFGESCAIAMLRNGTGHKPLDTKLTAEQVNVIAKYNVEGYPAYICEVADKLTEERRSRIPEGPHTRELWPSHWKEPLQQPSE